MYFDIGLHRLYVFHILWLGTSICCCLWKKNWDTFFFKFSAAILAAILEMCNCCYCFLHISALRTSFRMNRHFIFLYIWKYSWDILDSIFCGHLGRHLKKYATVVTFSTYSNSTSFISYESTLHLSLYLKAQLRYNRFKFSAAILAAILDKCNFCYFCLHIIWTLRPLFYMNWLIICLHILMQSSDTLNSGFWRPSWPPFWFLLFIWYYILHYNTSLIENHWNRITILTVFRIWSK